MLTNVHMHSASVKTNVDFFRIDAIFCLFINGLIQIAIVYIRLIFAGY